MRIFCRRIQAKSSKGTRWTFAWTLKGVRGLPGRTTGARQAGAPEAPKRGPLRNLASTTRSPSEWRILRRGHKNQHPRACAGFSSSFVKRTVQKVSCVLSSQERKEEAGSLAVLVFVLVLTLAVAFPLGPAPFPGQRVHGRRPGSF